LTSAVSPKEIITTATLFVRAGGILFTSDCKKVKSKEEVQYFVTLITNFRPVFTEGKGG